LANIHRRRVARDVVRCLVDEIDAKAARTQGWVNHGLLFHGEKGQPLRGSTVR